MIKYAPGLIIVCFALACNQPEKPAEKHNPPVNIIDTAHTTSTRNQLTITPGGGIGRVTIGENTDSVINALGKPDAGDAAMGSQLMTWYAGHDSAGHQTNVFGHRNMGAADEAISRVKAIRVTSPDFKTAELLRTGLSFDEIKVYFSTTKKSGGTKGRSIYEDPRAGIAFEVDGKNICRAIIVFGPGAGSGTYLSMGQ